MRIDIRGGLLGVLAAAASVSACQSDGGGGGGGDAGSALLGTLEPVAVDTTGKVQAFSLGSAPNAFYQSYLPIMLADFAGQFFAGGTPCPSSTEDGSTTTFTGGCTDDEGQTWSGTAVMTESAGGSKVTYDGFGFASITSCGGMGYSTSSEWNGELKLGGQPTPGGNVEFDVDLVVQIVGLDEEDCSLGDASWALVYSGEMQEGSQDGDGDGEPDTQVFSGSGEIGVDVATGDATIEGRVDVSTDDEVVVTTFTTDTSFSLCQTEALSGTTTYEGGGHESVITYDGATDCDDESTVAWSLDGTSQGEVSGVSCSVGAGASSRSAVLALASLLALVSATRRRRR